MLKAWRYVRWCTLLISLLVEAGVFWLSAPSGDFLTKALSPWPWIWMGFVAGSLAWLFFELTILIFKGKGRINAELDEDGNEEIRYQTVPHWLEPMREIRKHSATWYGIWVPVWIALASTTYLVGWVVWLASRFPEALSLWSVDACAFIETHFVGFLAIIGVPLEGLLKAIPAFLTQLHDTAREDTTLTFVLVGVVWLSLHAFEWGLRRWKMPHFITRLAHLGQWITVLVGFYALMATEWFDWLAPVYTFLPHNAIVAVGYMPLGLIAPLYYVPHVAEWLSTRYALIVDRKSSDAYLLICSGVFDFIKERISLERVVDTKLFQRWWQRPLKIGNLTLIETGGEKEILDIWDPRHLDREINKCITRRRRRQRGDEIVD